MPPRKRQRKNEVKCPQCQKSMAQKSLSKHLRLSSCGRFGGLADDANVLLQSEDESDVDLDVLISDDSSDEELGIPSHEMDSTTVASHALSTEGIDVDIVMEEPITFEPEVEEIVRFEEMEDTPVYVQVGVVECLIGRIRTMDGWAIIDRSDTYARTVFTLDD